MLLAGDKRVESVRELLSEDPELLLEAVREEFSGLHFYSPHESDAKVEGIEVDDLDLEEFHVVGLGETECTIAFSARVSFYADVEFDDSDSAIVDSSEGLFIRHRRYSGRVKDRAEVSGITKLKVNAAWSKFEDISHFDFNEGEVEISEVPPEESYYG
jgi:hypothetical protein